MKKNGGGKSLPGKLQAAVDSDLGGYDKFRADFIAAGTTQFGSGWAWLSVKDGKLAISKTANGESPLVYGASPILGVDVWEHSYYIDYRNARPKYLEAFVDSMINWDYVLITEKCTRLPPDNCSALPRHTSPATLLRGFFVEQSVSVC